jgi:hypothetical protein
MQRDVRLTTNAKRKARRLEVLYTDIVACVSVGQRFTRENRRKPNRPLTLSTDHCIAVLYDNADAHTALVIDVNPIREYRLNRNEPPHILLENFKYVKRKVHTASVNIPRFNPTQVIRWGPHRNAKQIICMKEIFSIIDDPNCRYLMRTQNVENIDDCHLQRTSAYRMACDYMEDPQGLINETVVLDLCRQWGRMCPTCSSPMQLGGGSSTAWADIVCTQCNTFIEVKTKNHLPRNGDFINGGSYRWFHAQANVSVRHYVAVVPRNGTHVGLYRIMRCVQKVDDKFLAHVNDEHWTGIEPSLKSKIQVHAHNAEWLAIQNPQLTREEMRNIAQRQIQTVFGKAHARKIQRTWRRWRQYNTQ